MTSAELAEIEGRLLAATPGPWQTRHGDPSTVETTASAAAENQREVCDTGFRDSPGGVGECRANARFIAHAPTDIAALLAEVRRLTPAVKVARWDGRELRDASGKVLAWYSARNGRFPAWTDNGSWYPHTEPEARAHIEAWARSKGWEVHNA